MKKADLVSIGILLLVPLCIFYPLFGAEYLYTDEAVQLRLYTKGSPFQMFSSQGRYITEKLFQWLFGAIESIGEVTYLRLFSFGGWMLSIPVWYLVLKKVIEQEGLPGFMAFFSVLYMIATPPFAVYVSWASCLELFLANTTGLLSGYFLYTAIHHHSKRILTGWGRVIISVVMGLVSLFTYQTGFGCFLLPFLLHLLSAKKASRVFWTGVAGCFFIYALYFVVFKISVAAGAVPINHRTSLYFNPLRKLFFMLTRPLSGSFHFTFLFNERSIAGVVVYLVVASAWFLSSFAQMRSYALKEKLAYFGALFLLLLCMYIPGLIVKENYASNRTLFTLNLAVWFMVTETLLRLISSRHRQQRTVAVLSLLFLANAWYNFHILFLAPIRTEYKQVRAFVQLHYKPGVHTVYFIRPGEDFFVRRYGITRSWDEFGVPSTFFDWVPQYWVQQVVQEITGSRAISDELLVKHWPDKEAFLLSGEKVTQGSLVIDVEQILSK